MVGCAFSSSRTEGYTVPGAAITPNEISIVEADHYVSYDQSNMRQIIMCDIYLWS